MCFKLPKMAYMLIYLVLMNPNTFTPYPQPDTVENIRSWSKVFKQCTLYTT